MWRMSWNLGALTSWNLQGLSRPLMGLLTLTKLILYLTLKGYADDNDEMRSDY